MTAVLNIPQPAGETLTKPQVAQNGFQASAELAAALQAVNVDLIVLSLVGKQAHWNLVGPGFKTLHEGLDDIIDIARDGSDEVAERMRAVWATPDGRPSVVAAETTIKEFPQGEISVEEAAKLTVEAIYATVATMRRVHDTVDEEDPVSVGIIEDLIAQLEQQAWFVGADLRTPQTR